MRAEVTFPHPPTEFESVRELAEWAEDYYLLKNALRNIKTADFSVQFRGEGEDGDVKMVVRTRDDKLDFSSGRIQLGDSSGTDPDRSGVSLK